MKTKHGKNLKHGWKIVPSCMQVGERTTLITSNTYLTYKEGGNRYVFNNKRARVRKHGE